MLNYNRYLFNLYRHSFNKNLLNLLCTRHWIIFMYVLYYMYIHLSLGTLFIYRRKYSEHWLSWIGEGPLSFVCFYTDGSKFQQSIRQFTTDNHSDSNINQTYRKL